MNIPDRMRLRITRAEAAAGRTPIWTAELPTAFPAEDGHRVVVGQPWLAAADGLPARFRGASHLSRGDLFSLASDLRRQRRPQWAGLLAASNAWGYGTTGYGWHRTRAILAQPDLDARLIAAVAILTDHGPVHAFYALRNQHHVTGLGPAFFTKFLYFASAGLDTPDALILDAVLAAAINRVSGKTVLRSAGWRTPEYAFYLVYLNRVAERVRQTALTDVTPGQVEMALFQQQGKMGQ